LILIDAGSISPTIGLRTLTALESGFVQLSSDIACYLLAYADRNFTKLPFTFAAAPAIDCNWNR
jgi:hypothetical protein